MLQLLLVDLQPANTHCKLCPIDHAMAVRWKLHEITARSNSGCISGPQVKKKLGNLLVDALRCRAAIFGWDLCRWLPCLYWPFPIFMLCVCVCLCCCRYLMDKNRCDSRAFSRLQRKHLAPPSTQFNIFSLLFAVSCLRISCGAYWDVWYQFMVCYTAACVSVYACLCPSKFNNLELTQDDNGETKYRNVRRSVLWLCQIEQVTNVKSYVSFARILTSQPMSGYALCNGKKEENPTLLKIWR